MKNLIHIVSGCAIFYFSALFLFFSPVVHSQDIGDIIKKADSLVTNLITISDKDENAIGKQFEDDYRSEVKYTTNNKFNVEKIFKKLKQQVKRTKINYRYHIVQTDEINAYALAGGLIYINTGLLKFLTSEDELAFVIGHEMSHIEYRHCINKIKPAIVAGQINENLGPIVQTVYQYYKMPFSQGEENEADFGGVKMMKGAGYNKKGAVSFFDKLEKLEAEYSTDERDVFGDFFASHPTAKSRKEKVAGY